MLGKILLGGLIGFLFGVGMTWFLVASQGNSAGRMGMSPLIAVPIPVLAIVGLIVGAVYGMNSKRK
jgi:hypothetical protein